MKKYIILTAILSSLAHSAMAQPSIEAIKLYNSGVHLYNQGQYTQAIQKYKNALQKDTNFHQAKNALENAYLKTGYDSYKQKEYSKAIYYYNQALSLNPKRTKLYSNLALLYKENNQFDLALQNHLKYLEFEPNNENSHRNIIYLGQKTNNHNLVINSCKKLLEQTPYDTEILYALANSYKKAGNIVECKNTYKKIIALAPNETDALHQLAKYSLDEGDYKLSHEYYRKILIVEPNDSVAKNNAKYAYSKIKDSYMSNNLNSLSVVEEGPKKLYKLIKFNRNTDTSLKPQVENMLNIIWSENNGRTLLEKMIKHKVPIIITGRMQKAYAKEQTSQYQMMLYGVIPITFGSSKKVEVCISESYVTAFNNKYLSAKDRIYALHVFVHEFAHAYRSLIDKNAKNAVEEELSASMIGYDLAHRVIRGQGLTEEESYNYSKMCMQSLLADEHRLLPIYNNFNSIVTSNGIQLPYPNTYSDLVRIYAELRSENKVQPAETFEKYVKYY